MIYVQFFLSLTTLNNLIDWYWYHQSSVTFPITLFFWPITVNEAYNTLWCRYHSAGDLSALGSIADKRVPWETRTGQPETLCSRFSSSRVLSFTIQHLYHSQCSFCISPSTPTDVPSCPSLPQAMLLSCIQSHGDPLAVLLCIAVTSSWGISIAKIY